MLKTGDKAPDFALMSGEGKILSLKDYRGRKIILYFYPKDDTSGCTKEACSFQKNIGMIKRKKAVVIGVSADSRESHSRFAKKYNLKFPLLSDEEKRVLKKYGVWKEKSMYGRKYFGIVRTTFIIDEKGIIRDIFNKVRVEGHVKELLSKI